MYFEFRMLPNGKDKLAHGRSTLSRDWEERICSIDLNGFGRINPQKVSKSEICVLFLHDTILKWLVDLCSFTLSR